MIVVCSRSPWVGGFLVYDVVRKSYPSEDIMFLLNDLDAPWGPGKNLNTHETRWDGHRSLRWNFPWTPDIPNELMNGFRGQCESLRTALGCPRGMLCLCGPTSAADTIYSVGANHWVSDFIVDSYEREVRWLNFLSGLVGGSCLYPPKLPRPGSVRHYAQAVAGIARLDLAVESLTELMFKEKVRSTQALIISTRDRVWQIDSQGHRYKRPRGLYQAAEGYRLVPRGQYLPFEFALRGWTVVLTNDDFIESIRREKDKFFKNLPLDIIKVKFNWQTDTDFVSAQIEAQAKRPRQKERAAKTLDGKAWKAITEYWAAHPTVMGWKMLGGNLNPKISREVL